MYSAGATSAWTLVAIRRRLVRKFREAGALDTQTAINLDTIRVQRTFLFNRMARAGVFVHTSPDQWYLNVEALNDYLARSHRNYFLFGVLGIVLAVLLIILFA